MGDRRVDGGCVLREVWVAFLGFAVHVPNILEQQTQVANDKMSICQYGAENFKFRQRERELQRRTSWAKKSSNAPDMVHEVHLSANPQ